MKQRNTVRALQLECADLDRANAVLERQLQQAIDVAGTQDAHARAVNDRQRAAMVRYEDALRRAVSCMLRVAQDLQVAPDEPGRQRMASDLDTVGRWVLARRDPHYAGLTDLPVLEPPWDVEER